MDIPKWIGYNKLDRIRIDMINKNCPYCNNVMINGGLYVIHGARTPRIILENQKHIKIQKYGFFTNHIKDISELIPKTCT